MLDAGDAICNSLADTGDAPRRIHHGGLFCVSGGRADVIKHTKPTVAVSAIKVVQWLHLDAETQWQRIREPCFIPSPLCTMDTRKFIA